MSRAAIALTLIGCSGGAPPPTTPPAPTPTPTTVATPSPADAAMPDTSLPPDTNTERRYRVYDGEELVLELSNQPGPIRSTAHSPGPPVRHPFLSASARSAVHEAQLRKLLVASKSFDEFVAALEGAGFRLEPNTP